MMKKCIKKILTIGAGLCLSISLLAGCGADKPEKTESADTKTEAKETKAELKTVEHPVFTAENVRRVVLRRGGEEIFHLSNEPADYKMDFDYWEILNPYDENATVNTEEMYRFLGMVSMLNFQNPVEVKEGTDTGIGDSSLSVTVDFVDTKDAAAAKETVYADSTAEIIIGEDDGEGNRYAAVKGAEENVYKLPVMILADIYSIEPFDCILKIPVLINVDTVECVEITDGEKTYQMKADTAEGNYKFGRKKAEKEEFAALYQELSSVMLDSEIKDASPLKEKEEKLKIVYHRNTKDAPEVTVTYFSYDETFDSVEINGKERFLVKAEDVDRLTESIKKAF